MSPGEAPIASKSAVFLTSSAIPGKCLIRVALVWRFLLSHVQYQEYGGRNSLVRLWI